MHHCAEVGAMIDINFEDNGLNTNPDKFLQNFNIFHKRDTFRANPQEHINVGIYL